MISSVPSSIRLSASGVTWTGASLTGRTVSATVSVSMPALPVPPFARSSVRTVRVSGPWKFKALR